MDESEESERSNGGDERAAAGPVEPGKKIEKFLGVRYAAVSAQTTPCRKRTRSEPETAEQRQQLVGCACRALGAFGCKRSCFAGPS